MSFAEDATVVGACSVVKDAARVLDFVVEDSPNNEELEVLPNNDFDLGNIQSVCER